MSRRVLIILTLAASAFLAACGAATSPTPAPTGTPVPTATPQPTSSPLPSGTPAIRLDVANDWQVTAEVVDHTGRLVGAQSGVGTATMTVRWFDSQVRNLDPTTVEVTWVGLPRDEEVRVEVSGSAGALDVFITQAAPPLLSDAEGLDRVIVLTFDGPVSADDLMVRFSGAPA